MKFSLFSFGIDKSYFFVSIANIDTYSLDRSLLEVAYLEGDWCVDLLFVRVL